LFKKVEIIAEIANAHQGNYKNAIFLAKEAFLNGADAVKFQVYFAEELLTFNHPRYKHFLRQSFTKNQWIEIFKSQQGKNIYCDVFGVKALKFLMNQKISGIKIHSSDLENIKLISEIRKPSKVFLSCGGSSFLEIAHSVSSLKKKKIIPILMHGFQAYPTSIYDVNFNKFIYLKNQFNKDVIMGYQDHTSGASKLNYFLPTLAIGLGAKVIEKHITLNRSEKGIDYYSSLEPKKFGDFVKIIRNIERTFLLQFKEFSENEKKYSKEVKKVWVTRKKIKINDILKINDIEMKRYPSSINLNNYNSDIKNILGKKFIVNLKKDEKILHSHLKQNIIATILVRSDSKRLPNKWKLKICGLELLGYLIQRVKLSKKINRIIVCTTTNIKDDEIEKFCENYDVEVFRGDNLNVLKRILEAVRKKKCDHIVRITGDDILIDPFYLDRAIEHHLKLNADYTDHKSLPSGTETEIFSKSLLDVLYKIIKYPEDTEYLTKYIIDNIDQFKVASAPILEAHKNKLSLTIDTKKDFIKVKKFLFYMKKKNRINTYNMYDIINFYKKELFNIKKKIKSFSPKTEMDWSKLV